METTVNCNNTLVNYCFPKRPSVCNSGKAMQLATNFFKFSFLNSSKKSFFKYSVDFEPELPGDSVQLRSKIWRKAREDIAKIFGHTIFNNTVCYSMENRVEVFEIPSTYNEQSYKIIIKWANLVDVESTESLSLFKKFFSGLVKKLNYVSMRRSYFNPKEGKTVENFEVWPGFNSAVNLFPSGILLNLNLIHRVLRPETALDTINNLKRKIKNSDDLMNELQEQFKNIVVLTRYNNDKTYIVDCIDFSKTPQDTFTTKSGEKTFIQYYNEKYNRLINEHNQPLLVHKDLKKNTVIYLIPELCYLTGLTDEMRSNFNTMKQLAAITKGAANEKMKESISLINTLLTNEKCMVDIKNWGLTIQKQPVTLTGRKLEAGNILMHKSKEGSRFSFPIDSTDDIDRKIQTEMYSQPIINKWMIFAQQKDKESVDTLLNTFKQVQNSFNYQMAQPLVFFTKGGQYKEWEELITKSITTDVKAVLLVIPGAKGKGFIYNDVKKLLTVKYPIPSQVILSSTLMKPKGLRSVINKVLIQMCAKVGGEPWAVDKMPFTSQPTMVVGLDSYNKFNKTIIGCCATFNNTFTRYISIVRTENQGADLKEKVRECIVEALEQFMKINKILPKHIIILRDGIAPGQLRTGESEVKEIKANIDASISLTYVILNKKNTLKVFLMGDNNTYSNIPPGTLVDNDIVRQDMYDFYLISQKTNQGLSQATYYHIIYDDFKVKPEDIQYFVYKQCYLYYNWTGGIKIPAPCQYAKKLAFLVGDKISTNKEIKIPGERFFKEIRSLFFL